MTPTTLRKRRAEVLEQVRQSRVVSVFWLYEVRTRWAAMESLEKDGKISFKVMPYPNYRVTIHRRKK